MDNGQQAYDEMVSEGLIIPEQMKKPTDEDEFYTRMVAEAERSVKAAIYLNECLNFVQNEINKALRK